MEAILNSDLLYDICTFLSAKDIFNLSLTSKTVYSSLQGNEIYRLMFLSKFGFNSNPIGSNWKNKFNLRVSASSRLYTWGSTDLGRLGYLIRDVPRENLTSNKNVKLPTVVSNFNEEVILDLKGNGFSFQILTDRGIYFTGRDYRKFNDLTAPGPVQADARIPMNALMRPGEIPNTRPHTVIPMPRTGGFNILPVGPAIPGPTTRTDQGLAAGHRPAADQSSAPRETNSNLRSPPDQIPSLRDFQTQQEEQLAEQRRIALEEQRRIDSQQPDPVESNFITKVKMPEKVLAMASGRQHFIALTDQDHIYTWDTGNSTLNGVKLSFPGVDHQPVQKIKCGWNTSGFSTKDDLVIWFSRTTVTRPHVDQNDFRSDANFLKVSVPGLIDFRLGCDFIIVSVPSGLYCYQFDTMEYYHNETGQTIIDFDDFEPMTGFNAWLNQANQKGTNFQFKKVTGCYNNFAAFVNDEKCTVLFGNKQTIKEEPQIIDLPPNVVEVEMGDYHFLALTDQGHLYSWGVESAGCGCLGVGDAKIQQGRNFKVEAPQKLQGTWVTICAGGWHSGGIGFM